MSVEPRMSCVTTGNNRRHGQAGQLDQDADIQVAAHLGISRRFVADHEAAWRAIMIDHPLCTS